jgi:nicotinamidase/pyrazinamidase
VPAVGYHGSVIEYDPTTALVVVDLQNDFADPAGSLSVAGGEVVVLRANDEVQRAVGAGARVVYTQDWHPPSTPHFAKDGGIWPVHCVAHSWGAEFHPALVVAGPIVRKGSHGEDGYSGFTMRDAAGDEHPTELATILHEWGVGRIAICGLATDYCVRATALDAVRLGFETIVLENVIAAVDLVSGDGRQALDEVALAGARLE